MNWKNQGSFSVSKIHTPKQLFDRKERILATIGLLVTSSSAFAACTVGLEEYADWTFGSATSATLTLNSKTATMSATSLATGSGSGLAAVHSPVTGTNFPGTFFTPTPGGCVEWLQQAITGGYFQYTIFFSPPITDPKFHFLNADRAQIDFTGTQTTGGSPVIVNRLSGNNEFEVTGTIVNSTTAGADQGGCEANDGTNPNGACGTVQLVGSYQTINYKIMASAGDGYYSTISETLPDADGDTIPDSADNCPNTANTNQVDTDADGIGDVCETYAVTLATAGTGTGTVAGNGNFAAGATVNLTATPDASSTFAGWSPSPCADSFTMPANDVTCTATFNATAVPPPSSGDGGNDNPYIPPPPPPETKVIVAFGGNGKGKVTSNPSGIGCQAPTACNYTFKTGETIQLTPQAIGNSRFQNWGNTCNDGIISAAGKTVYCMVYFVDTTPINYPLSVSKTGSGDGKITSNPTGIDCGTACQKGFSNTVEVELIAEPVVGSTFIGWSGDCDGESSHTHTKISQAKTCVAQFDVLPPPPLNHFPLTVTKTGDGNGVVTSQDAQIQCGDTCTTTYDVNSTVTLTAVADTDALFLRWEGDCTGNENSVVITMDKAKSCLVFFDLKTLPPTLPPILNEKLSVEKHGSGEGQVTSDPFGLLLHFDDTFGAEASADFPLGQVIKLIVETKPGTTFAGLTGDPDCEDREVTLDKSKHCSVHFEITPPANDTTEPVIEEPPVTEEPVDVIPEPEPVPPVTVLPPAVSNETCPPKDTLSYYCNAQGQTIGDLNIVENPEAINGVGFLSNAVIVGTVQLADETWIANLRVTKTGIVIGGTVTGLNTNAGYMGDFIFKGEFIKGGMLGGKIINLSKIFSWFEDVTLTANAHLIGGALKGNIKGDPKNPALLENLRILSGSVVSGVIIGNGVKIDKDVEIEESIQDDTPADEAELPALDKQFSAGIGVNDSSYQTRNVAQILSDNVSIRGKIHANKKHVGQKVKIFVSVAYRLSEDSDEEFLFTINQLNGLMPWNGDLEKLGEEPFREEVLQTSHTVKIYDGILLATGVVKIRFGYLSSDGTVVQSSESIELVTTE